MLKELSAGDDTTQQVARPIELIKGLTPLPKHISVRQIQELVNLFEKREPPWSDGLNNMVLHVHKHLNNF